MNKAILAGRICRDPKVTYTQTQEPLCVARFTLAVDRRYGKAKEGESNADFISCVAFGKQAEFCQNYLHQGSKIGLVGRIQTGKYQDKKGQTVYTTDVVAESLEFMESKKASQGAQTQQKKEEDFMSIPEGADELPWA